MPENLCIISRKKTGCPLYSGEGVAIKNQNIEGKPSISVEIGAEYYNIMDENTAREIYPELNELTDRIFSILNGPLNEILPGVRELNGKIPFKIRVVKSGELSPECA